MFLLVAYLAVGFAVVAYAGATFLTDNAEEEEFIFALLGTEVLGSLPSQVSQEFPENLYS